MIDDLVEPGRTCAPAEVDRAEAALGVVFPDCLRYVLLKGRGLTVNGQEIMGLRGEDDRHDDIIDIVRYNLSERAETGLPDHILLVAPGIDGDCYGLDLTDRQGREPPVVIWPSGGSGGELEIYAESLPDLVEEWTGLDVSPRPKVPVDPTWRRKSRLP